jgi:hypothetical protein
MAFSYHCVEQLETTIVSRKLLLILFVLTLTGVCLAGAELLSFRVYPVIDHCQMEWTTGVENDLQVFVVERSADGLEFSPVGHLNARGSFSDYTFTDASPLDVDMNRTFYYRIKLVDRNGAFQYSEVRTVSLTFTAVQHTWGSIKAMFR